MTAKRRPQPPRPIPPDYPTGAAKLAAEEGQRYYVDSGGNESVDLGDGRPILLNPFYGIRDRETGQFDARRGMTRSQVYDEVARLNAGLPVSAVSQGIGRGSPAVKKGDAAWWADLLIHAEQTRAILQNAINTGRKLSADDVLELMTYHDDTGVDFRASFPTRLPTQQLSLPPRPTPARPIVTEADERRWHAQLGAHAAECQRLQQEAEQTEQAAKKAEHTLAKSVLKQINRAFGVQKRDGRNDHRAAKKGTR